MLGCFKYDIDWYALICNFAAGPCCSWTFRCDINFWTSSFYDTLSAISCPPTKPTCSLGGSDLRDSRPCRALTKACPCTMTWEISREQKPMPLLTEAIWRCGRNPSVGLEKFMEDQQHHIFWLVVKNYMFLFTLYILIDICFPHLDSCDILGWWSNTIWMIWLRLGSKRV